MLRLFVALELPMAMRDVLLGAMGGVAGARWQRDDQLHLTLRFIGEVDRHRAVDIAAALASVRFDPLELALAGPGSFDRRGRIDTLWVGVSPAEGVTALAQRINQALLRVGIAPDARAFIPHITVARLPRNAGSIGDFPNQALPTTRFRITGFALWQSQLGHDGADYEVIERYGRHGL
jgi:RNA 2',3'-cyclic 3'-phosphodiesterase